MVDSPFDRDPVEVLAAEFVERLRLGENPTVDEYVAMHPELADEIRDLFPTIATMEGLKTPKEDTSSKHASLGTINLKQLGDFRIIRELGRGGMGIVYEARQESLERTVAVKVLPKLALLDSMHLQRFQREAQTAANLHHTNIVPVFGVGHQDGFHYYAMQYIEGAGLDRVLTRLESSEATTQKSDITTIVRELATTVGSANETQVEGDEHVPLSISLSFDTASQPTKSFSDEPVATTPTEHPQPKEEESLPSVTKRTDARDSSYWKMVTQIGIQVAEALEYAHGKGVLHRDVKPANLIVDTQGVVWVADFGLAKAMEQDHLSRTGDVLGTPAYMSPEQLRGQTDLRSDIYSLGITLCELLTLRSAFPETDRSRLFERIANEEPVRPRQVRPDIPRDLETIVMKATAHEPNRRYQSAAELASDLHCFLDDRPIQARRSSSVERFWRWCRRNPVVAGLSMTAVMLLILVAITATIGYVHTTRALAAEQAQRQRAESQRQRAESATNLALQALDRIYERFAPPSIGNETANKMANGSNNNRTMKPVLSEGAAAVLEELLVFYDRLAEQGDNDSQYLEEIALANRRVGDIRHNLGQLEQAKDAYEHAIDLYEKLDRSSPDKPHLFETAILYTELGIMLDRLQNRQEAVESWKASLKMLQEMEKQAPKDQKIQNAISRTRGFLDRGKNSPRPLPFRPPGEPFGPPRQRPPSREPAYPPANRPPT